MRHGKKSAGDNRRTWRMGRERAPSFFLCFPSDPAGMERSRSFTRGCGSDISFLPPSGFPPGTSRRGIRRCAWRWKAQAGSPEFAGPRLVDPVEPLDRKLLFLSSRPGGETAPSGESVRTANPVQTTACFGVKKGFCRNAVDGGNPVWGWRVLQGARQSPRSCV